MGGIGRVRIFLIDVARRVFFFGFHFPPKARLEGWLGARSCARSVRRRVRLPSSKKSSRRPSSHEVSNGECETWWLFALLRLFVSF